MTIKPKDSLDDTGDEDELPEESQEESQADEWCIATWHVGYEARLLFVQSHGEKPLPNFHAGADCYRAHTWRSYHAARKYLRSHVELTGYIIVNLSEMKRQRDTVRAFEEKRREAIREQERYNPNVRSSLDT